MENSESGQPPAPVTPEGEKPQPILPPLPDIATLVAKIKRQSDKAKSVERRVAFLDVGIEELNQIKMEGWAQYHELVDQKRLDDPDPFWHYDSELDLAINELRILRQRLILEEPERKPSPDKESELQPSPAQSMPTFAPSQGSTLTAEPHTPSPEVMDVEALAVFLKSSASWIYKNYEAEGIPYFSLGTSLRFRRDEVIGWINNRGKSASTVVTPLRSKRGKKGSPRLKRQTEEGSPAASPVPEENSIGTDLGTLPPPSEKAEAIVDKLITILVSKLGMNSVESVKLREWLVYNAPSRKEGDRVRWPIEDRRSLSTFLVLCQHANILHLPTGTKKDGAVGPRYSVALREGFLLPSGLITTAIAESIDRSHLNPIEALVTAFEKKVYELMMNEIDPGISWRHELFSALQKYYEVICGESTYKGHAEAIGETLKKVDRNILRAFYELTVEMPELASFTG
jgi:hypothetical protein